GYTELGKGVDGGVRVLAASRMFGLSAGADFDIDRKDVAAMFSFQTAGRRGGIAGRGTMVRLDWLPARNHHVGIGVQVPLFQPFAGKTRPHRTSVSIEKADETPFPSSTGIVPAARQALDRAGNAASLIAAFTNL